MNFIKLSVSHEYLYSPKNWLHHQNSRSKIIISTICLVLLLTASLQYIALLLLLTLLLCGLLNMHDDLRQYFYTTFAILSFLLLISMHRYDIDQNNELNSRKMVCFYRSKSCYISMSIGKKMSISSLCLPISAIRLTSLHFVYIALIRLLLLTTNYANIVETTLVNCRNKHRYFGGKFIFATTVSSHLLKILFDQIKAVQISYILRSNNSYCVKGPKMILLTCIPFLQEFLAKTSARIYGISSTLYSRNIQCANLDRHKLYID